MKGQQKIFYIFLCPFSKYTGVVAVKIGISAHFDIRLGVYQNSYSSLNHVAGFNIAYIGDTIAINNLEKTIKQHFDWEIEKDGRGHSEWISGVSLEDIVAKVDEIINGYRYKVEKVDQQFLPLTIHNADEFKNHYKLDN